MLSQKQLKDICMLGGGVHECRYLDGEPDSKTGTYRYLCKKQSLERKAVDDEVNEFVQECKANGQNPRTQGFPLGDNCQGFLPLENLLQGYDV